MGTEDRLRVIPSVTDILAQTEIAELVARTGRSAVVEVIRACVQQLRQELEKAPSSPQRETCLPWIVAAVRDQIDAQEATRLGPVINATGIVLHTSLGRAPLAEAVTRDLAWAGQACNLEVDPLTGDRRRRGYQLTQLWGQLTGAEAACVVNNNAAATLLALQALCAGREVIISRGQLIEIGGSFRLPEIFALAGVTLREVGTTNRTHLADYARAITPQTAAILRVHPSNYRVVGFTESPRIEDLVRLGQQHGVLVLDDIGSGCLLDLTRLGVPAEPTFADSLQAGADIVLGSGDKLLGGPQCGIILGRAACIEQIERHPLARAVRVDKLTLAALSRTLQIYAQGHAEQQIPVLTMLAATMDGLARRSAAMVAGLDPAVWQVRLEPGRSEAGGGSLPETGLPTMLIRLEHSQLPAQQLARQLRLGSPAVWGRVQHDAVYLDLRSVLPVDDIRIAEALQRLASTASPA